MKRLGLALSFFAAACAANQAAPISYGSAPPRAYDAPRRAAPAPTPAPVEPAAPRPHVSENAPDWADGEGTPLSTFALRPEDAQPHDPTRTPRTHRVGENEALYDIATEYQIPLRALIEQNDLEPPYALAPGQEIDLPPPRLHRVTRGESFEDVARRYSVDTRSLALLNRMQPPYNVQPGDAIVLPALARAAPEALAPSATSTPAPTANAIFAWPLRGEIVTRFGAQPGGRRLDGVEIAAREGEPAGAAADGEVVYAGDDLPAYGALVLVRHEGGYVTAYGYGARALVREGERVRRGQALVEIGRVSGRPRLLFQVRRNTEAVDPLPLLGG